MKYKRSIFWLLQLAVWSSYLLYNLNVVHGLAMPEQREIVLLYVVLYSYFAIPLTLLLRYFYNWLRKKEISNWVFAISVFCSTLIAANIWAIEVYFLDRLFENANVNVTPVTLKFYIWELFGDFLVLLGWSAFYLLIKLWYEWQMEKEKANKAILLAQESQLRMLRNQINPHFLFNTLSSLRALVRDNQKKAEEMIVKISEFLRYSLVSRKDLEVPLSNEIEAVKNYIDIERVRYGENLEAHYDVDPLSEDYPVICFLLHPIVENAIKYGMDTSKMPLIIEIKTSVTDNKLLVFISNTGKWVSNETNNDQNGTGTGLTIVQERLKHNYPESHSFKVDLQEDKVLVMIELINKIVEKVEQED
jgi:two-component system, LytTR family, sensor kinase